MKDGDGAAAPAELSRQQLYGDYVSWYRQPGAEVRPCRDPSLLERTALYLRGEPERAQAFTVFPFYRAVSRERAGRERADGRKHLSAFMRATELLETICVNLFLQPWKKEIRTLKTFTGPFTYGLLPVLSTSTIQSVLGSIGYLPHTDAAQSEYRLREDVNPDSAMLLGFELLLARVKCHQLLESLEKDQLEPEEVLEVLQRRMEPTAPDEPPETKTTMRQEEEEEEKMEEARRQEVPLTLDPLLAVKPQPKPRRCRPTGVDQSIMEMQRSYPDLAFRGRPLLPDKPKGANGGSADVSDNGGDGRAAEVPKVAATAMRSRNDGSRADEGVGGGAGPAARDANSSHISATDGGAADGELGGLQALSLHITLRAAATAEPGLRPREAAPPAEPPARTQQQTGADLQNNRPAKPRRASASFTDESQELRELAESMARLHVQDATEDGKSKEGNQRVEGNASKGRRQTESEAEEENLGRPPIRSTRPSQSDPAAPEERKQLALRRRSTPADGCRGGGGTERQEAEDTVRAGPGRDEEQLAKSYVMVERHNK